MMDPFLPEFTDESDCTPLTPAQLAARDEAWPEYAPGVDGEVASLAISKAQQSVAWADNFLAAEEKNGLIIFWQRRRRKMEFIPEFADESDCAPLASAGSLAGDIRAKLAEAESLVAIGRYGHHFEPSSVLEQFMDECRAFLAELEARNEF